MALAKKGLRHIQVEEEEFVWRIRKKVSHEERHDAQLGISIQHISGGGLFVAYVNYSRSGYEVYGIGPQRRKEVTPAIVESQIRQAISLGWDYKKPGRPVSILDGQLTENVWVARWHSDHPNNVTGSAAP